MALEDKIEAVKKVSKALSKQVTPVEPELERLPPNKEKFDALLQTEQVNQQTQNRKIQESALTIESTSSTASNKTNSSPISLMEEVKKLHTQVNRIDHLEPEELKNQARHIIAQIDEVKGQLSETSATLKPSYKSLLSNRLTHIDDNLKITLSKAGIEYKDVQPIPNLNATNASPVEKFIGYLTHGQYQLDHVLETLNENKLTPASMLTLQIKMGQIQQEIELFTSLLNKALESTKSIMNVQV
jgi:hypothetical protein